MTDWPMPKPPPYSADDEGRVAKWDAIAEAFAAGTLVPANGMQAWNEQATQEAITIRAALPSTVDCLIEVGCGVGRLTPYLAVMFPRVIATDTSSACRVVTRERCRQHGNVRVMAPRSLPRAAGDAALVWGNLWDSDWSDAEVAHHLDALVAAYPLVLCEPITRHVLRGTWPINCTDEWCLIGQHREP